MSSQETLTKAVQKAIDGYEATQVGRIWNRKTGKEVKGSINTNGYLCFKVWLPDLKISKRIYHHRLVAEQLLPNPKKYNEVNHINGNKLNNATWNLEWTDHKGNMHHAWKNKLLPKPPHVYGEKAGNHKLTRKQVEDIRFMKLAGKTNVYIAGQFDVHHSTVARITNGQTWAQMVIADDPIEYLGKNI